MQLNIEDVHLLKKALAFYEAEITKSTESSLWVNHKEEFGDPAETIDATDRKLWSMLIEKVG